MSFNESSLCLQPSLRWNGKKPRKWKGSKPNRKFDTRPLSKNNKKTNQTQLNQTLKDIVLKVSLADNYETPSESSDVDENVPQIVFDPNNPQELDLQGLDQLHTYRTDEQRIQLDREYRIMRRELEKQKLYREEPERYAQFKRDKRYGLPDLYNMKVAYVPIESTIDPPRVRRRKVKTEDLDICDTRPSVVTTTTETVKRFENIELWRTDMKPKNKAIRALEVERRVNDLHVRLDKLEEKEKLAQKLKDEEEERAKETFVMDLAQADFEQTFNGEKGEMKRVVATNRPLKSKKVTRYPNKFKDLQKLRQKLANEQIEARDKALIKQQIYSKLDKYSTTPEKLKELSEFQSHPSVVPTPLVEDELFNEGSTDSEDGISIGYKTEEKFQLRGFHDTLSSEPRGIHLHHGDKPKIHTCQTREEWIQSILTDTAPKRYHRQSNPNISDPNHPRFDIFWKPMQPITPTVESPVRQYIRGGSKAILKDSVRVTEPQFVPPKQVKTKKFSLTGYLYGKAEDTKTELKKAEQSLHALKEASKVDVKAAENLAETSLNKLKDVSTIDSLVSRVLTEREIEQQKRRERRRERLALLKIPYYPCEDKDQQDNDEGSHSESDTSSAWLPNQDTFSSYDLPSHIELKTEHIPLKISNLCAPEYREPTLRRHPRRPRQSSDKLVSALDQKDSRAPFNRPRIRRLESDQIRLANLEEPKNEDLENIVKYRHHHDHQIKHQQKLVQVKYVPKLSKFNPPNLDVKEKEREKIIPDLPVPELKRDYDWSRHGFQNEVVAEEVEGENSDNEKEKLIQATDYDDRTTSKSENVFAKFLQKKFISLQDKAEGKPEIPPHKYAEAESYRQQVLDEQKSIDSCLSSAPSSLCTNFTNDSGTYMIIFDHKVPMNYLVKNEVPFRARYENHMKTEIVRERDEYLAPYFVAPNSGQLIGMRELCLPADKFYTKQTRAMAVRKEKLKVKDELIDIEMVGKGDKVFKVRYG